MSDSDPFWTRLSHWQEEDVPEEDANIYRSINERELAELLDINNLTLKGLFDHDGELDMTIHLGTKWDPFPDNFPAMLIERSEGILVVEVRKTLREMNVGYPKSCVGLTGKGVGAWWMPKETENVKAKVFALNIEWARRVLSQE